MPDCSKESPGPSTSHDKHCYAVFTSDSRELDSPPSAAATRPRGSMVRLSNWTPQTHLFSVHYGNINRPPPGGGAYVAIARPGSTIIMHATFRQYSGITPATFDALIGRKSEIETLIRKVPGFVQYDLVRTTDGMTTLTICNDRPVPRRPTNRWRPGLGRICRRCKHLPP